MNDLLSSSLGTEIRETIFGMLILYWAPKVFSTNLLNLVSSNWISDFDLSCLI